jgi:hypothetical protein
MAIIQIKRSPGDSKPSSLRFGELATNGSGTLFVGNSSGEVCVVKSNKLSINSTSTVDFNAETILANTTAGGFTLTLPSLQDKIYDGFKLYVKNIGSVNNHFLTINTASSTEYIGNPNTITASLDMHQYATYVGDFNTMCWHRIA